MTKTTTVREFSRCGPCIVLGKLLKETARFYCYQEDRNNTGAVRKIAKRLPDKYSPAHIVPCPSCQDHERTQFPNGYMD